MQNYNFNTNFTISGELSGVIKVYQDEISFGLTSQFGILFLVSFSIDEFMVYLHDNKIEIVEGGQVLIDWYVEDDDCETYCITEGVKFEDYIMNYIRPQSIKKVLQKHLNYLTEKFNQI